MEARPEESAATPEWPLWGEERALQLRALSELYENGESALTRDLAALRERVHDELTAATLSAAKEQLAVQVGIERARLHGLEDGEATVLLEGAHEITGCLYLASLASGERLRWLRYLSDALTDKVSIEYETLFESEMRWIDLQARALAKVESESEADAIRENVQSHRHELQGKTLDDWLEQSCEEGGSDGEDEGEGHGEKHEHDAAAEFRQAWKRVLEAHEFESDLAVTQFPDREKIDALLRARAECIDFCRAELDRLEPASREALLVDIVSETENHASSLLSEGDLLETDERATKYRAAAALIEDLARVLDSKRPDRRWFSDSSLRRAGFAREYRHLNWVRRYALKSAQTAEVDRDLQDRFGRRWLRRFENTIFVLIFLLVGLVVVEWWMESRGTLTTAWAYGFQMADLLICSVLLFDVYIRWRAARWAPWFLRRHFVFDFLPALPYGFILGPIWHAGHVVDRILGPMLESHHLFAGGISRLSENIHTLELAHYAHLLLILRVFRFMRLLRGVRIATAALRLFRLFVFMVRGMDRVVQRFRGFLDRDVLFFEPYPPDVDEREPYVVALSHQEARRIRLSRELYRETPWKERAELLGGHVAILRHEIASIPDDIGRTVTRFREDRELHLEAIVVKLTTCDSLMIESTFGQKDVERLAQLLRWADLPIIRSLPLFKNWAIASRVPEPAQAVADAARELGQFLQRVVGIFHLGGDLSGITTGPQILDRVATAMIKSTQRPAVRLIVIGGVASVLSVVLPESLEKVSTGLRNLVSTPLVVLGVICLSINVVGRWFKRISGEALDIYMRTSEAHFFHLVKEIKSRRFDKDLQDILQRVVYPECRLRGLTRDETSATTQFLESKLTLLGNAATNGGNDTDSSDFADFLYREIEQVALLYRDYLDGTLLERSSDKTSIQLLGNLAMRDIRFSMLGMRKRDARRLEKLALEKDRMLGFGPYLWFRFISESLAIETAKLVMEYNSSCIPLRRLAHAPEDLRKRYDEFMEEKREKLDPAARRVRRSRIDFNKAAMMTTEFHALHFLLPDEERDRRVSRIFGDEVFKAFVDDRRAMVRDVFGTWPYHLLPRSARRLNPYRLYFRYLGGARVVLLPLVVAGRALGLVAYTARRLVQIVLEVLGKRQDVRNSRPRSAGFDVAVRKINRMRKPYFMEAMRLRAAVDAEYLGLRIPGIDSLESGATFVDDLDFIGALDRERVPFEAMRRAVIRDLRGLKLFLAERRWLGTEFEDCLEAIDADQTITGGRADEVLRALVSAFITDQHSLRTMITGPREMRDFIGTTIERPPPTLLLRLWKGLWHCTVTRMLSSCRARRRLFAEFAAVDARLESASDGERGRVLEAFLEAPRHVVSHCEAALELVKDRVAYDEKILAALRRVATEHALWSRKLITLRVVQSLTLLDIKAYRQLIWSLGGFEETPAADALISRGAVGRSPAPLS